MSGKTKKSEKRDSVENGKEKEEDDDEKEKLYQMVENQCDDPMDFYKIVHLPPWTTTAKRRVDWKIHMESVRNNQTFLKIAQQLECRNCGDNLSMIYCTRMHQKKYAAVKHAIRLHYIRHGKQAEEEEIMKDLKWCTQHEMDVLENIIAITKFLSQMSEYRKISSDASPLNISVSTESLANLMQGMQMVLNEFKEGCCGEECEMRYRSFCRRRDSRKHVMCV
jgi:uncharacterized protein YerC